MQLDYFGKFDGKKYLLDWKAAKGHYRDMRIQTAGYRGGLEAHGYNVEGHGVVRLDKETGIPDFKDYSEYFFDDLNEFLISKRLYMARHPRIAGQLKIIVS